METLVNKIKDVLKDAKELESACSYNDFYLFFGNEQKQEESIAHRSNYIKKAEQIFIEQNKKEVLIIASKLCRDTIGDLTDLFKVEVVK